MKKRKKIQKIAAAIDFSKYSVDVMRYAAFFAEKLDATLTAVNVINKRETDVIFVAELGLPEMSVKNYVKQEKARRLELFKKLLEDAGRPQMPVKKIIRRGVPSAELIQAIKNEKANMVVMGAKGRSDLQGVLFGTTAEQMLHRSPVPVLSLREKKQT